MLASYRAVLWNSLGLVVRELLGPHEDLFFVGGRGSSELGHLGSLAIGKIWAGF